MSREKKHVAVWLLFLAFQKITFGINFYQNGMSLQFGAFIIYLRVFLGC
jgi:hypothetical protein